MRLNSKGLATTFSVTRIYYAGVLLRLIFIIYSNIHDSFFQVKFTDIDYLVYSDATNAFADGFSPYSRQTFRYSPLLCYILYPIVTFKDYGKVLFCVCDIINATLMLRYLQSIGVTDKVLKLSALGHLFNPLTLTLSCRGSFESLFLMFLNLTLYHIRLKHAFLAGIWFGIATHLRIYPVIFSPALYFYWITEKLHVGKQLNLLLRYLVPNRDQLKFASAAIFTFCFLFLFCFNRFGMDFINHTYLYHVTRKDVKHNFSIFFYFLYLTEQTSGSDHVMHYFLTYVTKLLFLPQVIIIIISSIALHRDPAFCIFIQTFVFVTFNKVCTSQYFLWYIFFLPFVWHNLSLTRTTAISLIIAWSLGQGLWLFPAYLLEFQGENTFIFIWFSSILFFIINVTIICTFIDSYRIGLKRRRQSMKIEH